jgi:hypothetical protein
MRHSLPVLNDGPRLDPVDRIEIPIPCQVPWDSMVGDEMVRHCGQCRQNVYNLIAMTRAEALRLLEERAGRVCLRIFRRPDGTVITDDCRARLRAARKRGWLVFAGVLLIVAWGQLCAQVVGLAGLRRLLASRGTHGAPPVATAPLVPAPAIEVLSGAPPPPPGPIQGEEAARPPHERHHRAHPKMGKKAPPPEPMEMMGDVIGAE